MGERRLTDAAVQQNPFPGNVINKPNGDNLYVDVPRDYVGKDVTGSNLFAVLRGDAANASGRVLHTTADDNIFLYYADHGGYGLIAMPVGPYVYGDQLVQLLVDMSTHHQFHEMVVFVEAGESGALFADRLPADAHIYACTAAGKDQSTYAWYYDDVRKTYLGDQWSIN